MLLESRKSLNMSKVQSTVSLLMVIDFGSKVASSRAQNFGDEDSLEHLPIFTFNTSVQSLRGGWFSFRKEMGHCSFQIIPNFHTVHGSGRNL